MKLARILYEGEACEASVDVQRLPDHHAPVELAGTLVVGAGCPASAARSPRQDPGGGVELPGSHEGDGTAEGRRRGGDGAAHRRGAAAHPVPQAAVQPHRPWRRDRLPPGRHPGGVRRRIGRGIARETRRVTPEEARDAVLGWTCANDVTERDLQGQDKQWWRAKGYRHLRRGRPLPGDRGPGPDAWIRTRVNGELRQEGQVGDMIRDPFEIISLVSQAMTLQRGDLIMLGTPPAWASSIPATRSRWRSTESATCATRCAPRKGERDSHRSGRRAKCRPSRSPAGPGPAEARLERCRPPRSPQSWACCRTAKAVIFERPTARRW